MQTSEESPLTLISEELLLTLIPKLHAFFTNQVHIIFILITKSYIWNKER